jgi:5-methyltetrahydropteroyltriglutamate--homocysteine methyltransferase
MRRSSERILTTHVGNLPGRHEFSGDIWQDERRLRDAVADVVQRQLETGLDIINEGEFTKGGDWLTYIDGRLGGFEVRSTEGEVPIIAQGKDREVFADFYKDATARGTLFYAPTHISPSRRKHWTCTGPITYQAQPALRRELDTFRSVAPAGDGAELFFTTTSPSSFEPYHKNGYYRTEEEYIFAFAEAMRTEYEMIADAGLLVQVDDAWLVALWDRIGIAMGLENFRKRSLMRVEALNHALSNIPEEKVRYHLCWGSWHGPHAFDIPLIDVVDIMLRVKAQAYLIEAANVRHEHEHYVWETVRLPDRKILVPGVVTHSTDVVEHPMLVAQRIQRFAKLVGRENVIAGADCGFGDRSHPQIAWAKLKSLTEGAAMATRRCGGDNPATCSVVPARRIGANLSCVSRAQRSTK